MERGDGAVCCSGCIARWRGSVAGQTRQAERQPSPGGGGTRLTRTRTYAGRTCTCTCTCTRTRHERRTQATQLPVIIPCGEGGAQPRVALEAGARARARASNVHPATAPYPNMPLYSQHHGAPLHPRHSRRPASARVLTPPLPPSLPPSPHTHPGTTSLPSLVGERAPSVPPTPPPPIVASSATRCVF